MNRDRDNFARENAAEAGRSGWRRWRTRLFHAAFLVQRPMTLGVRAIVHDAPSDGVFLIRHTYVPGWQLPGGGVEVGETMLDALKREVREEAAIELLSEPELRSIHLNRHVSRRDHVAVYLCRVWRQLGTKLPDFEIAESGFFALDALPEGTTPATRRRLDEAFSGRPPADIW